MHANFLHRGFSAFMKCTQSTGTLSIAVKYFITWSVQYCSKSVSFISIVRMCSIYSDLRLLKIMWMMILPPEIKAYKQALTVLHHTELGHWGHLHETVCILHDDILFSIRVRLNLEIVSLMFKLTHGLCTYIIHRQCQPMRKRFTRYQIIRAWEIWEAF